MDSLIIKTAPQTRTGLAPTRFWIGMGAVWFVFCIVVWGAWITGPDFKPNNIGADQAPHSYVVLIRCLELVSILLAIAQIWYFIIRPKLRTGRLSFDGIFFLACWMLYIQEPGLDYNSNQFIYNTVDYNMGSWCRYIPGWNSPNAQLIPVGSIIWCLAYLTLVGLWAYTGSSLMGWAQRRWPGLAAWQLMGICFLAFIPADLILEHGIVYYQLFNYASTVPSLTLNAGKTDQFPLYEVLSWCATLTCLASIHFFRNEQGEFFVERYIHTLKVGARIKTWLRFFAILGLAQTCFLLCYNVPYFYWSTKGGAYPPYPAYKIAGVCGPGTNFDCPSLTTPLPKADTLSNHVPQN
jgi:hypothetical protein